MSDKEFKGFDDYVEIFRGGTQVDSGGTKHNGNELIDKAVTTFNAAEHQPPLVVGHPKDNAPAFGWVKDLKVAETGGVKTLLAKFVEVADEFKDLAARGLYKKRSAAFYPDGRLRHVGFLGAVPPAVKGLADILFEDGGGQPVTFEFEAGTPAKEEEGKAQGHASENDHGKNSQEEQTMAEKTFSEADLEQAKADAAAAAKAEGKKEAAAEFAEQEQKRKKDEAKERIAAFCQDGVDKGTLLPAWIDGGLKEFMEGLDIGETLSFADGSTKPPLTWFMEFMDKLPQAITFKEVAGRDDEAADNNNAIDIAKRAREFQDSEARAGRTISITEAVGEVTRK